MSKPKVVIANRLCNDGERIQIGEYHNMSVMDCDKQCKADGCVNFMMGRRSDAGTCKTYFEKCGPSRHDNLNWNVYAPSEDTSSSAMANAKEIALLKQQLQIKMLEEQLANSRMVILL